MFDYLQNPHVLCVYATQEQNRFAAFQKEVHKFDYDTEILTKDEHAKYVKDDMERLFKVDDVVVTNVQDFIRDCDETDTDLE